MDTDFLQEERSMGRMILNLLERSFESDRAGVTLSDRRAGGWLVGEASGKVFGVWDFFAGIWDSRVSPSKRMLSTPL